MSDLEATHERFHLAVMASTGNWNIMRGSANSDPELMEMLDAGIFVLVYTSHLTARGMEGVRLSGRGWEWLASARQEAP
jgi:hypothetical protein